MTEKLSNLLLAGEDANAPDQNGVVPLFHAIRFGNVEMVRLLLEAGAEVNYTNWQGQSPWLIAVESKDRRKIKLLKQNHADMTIQNYLGHNALHLTAMRGDLRLFHELVHGSPEVAILAVNRWGDTIMHLAVSWHHFHAVKICLTHTKLDPDARNADGESAFLKALKGGDLKIAGLLLHHGCDFDLADLRHFHPLVAAMKYLAHDADTLAFIADLLARGAAPDICNHLNETPLLLSAKSNWTEMAELLLRYPVRVNHIGDDRRASIHFAFANHNETMLKLLLDHDADPNLMDGKKTLLYQAVCDNNVVVAELLLRAGADCTIAFKAEDSKEELLPMDVATRNKNAEIIQLLARYGTRRN